MLILQIKRSQILCVGLLALATESKDRDFIRVRLDTAIPLCSDWPASGTGGLLGAELCPVRRQQHPFSNNQLNHAAYEGSLWKQLSFNFCAEIKTLLVSCCWLVTVPVVVLLWFCFYLLSNLTKLPLEQKKTLLRDMLTSAWILVLLSSWLWSACVGQYVSTAVGTAALA